MLHWAWLYVARAENFAGLFQSTGLSASQVRLRLFLRAGVLLLAITLLQGSGCSSGSAPAKTASPRLHLVATLYGKYVAANSKEMPADEQEFVKYIDANEREVLQRYGLRSGQDIFIQAADRPRLVVLYRDQRQRLPSEFVAIEELKVSSEEPGGPKTGTPKTRSSWIAADVLGIGQEISADEANRVLADADAAASKSSEPVSEKNTAGDKEKNKKTGQKPRSMQPKFARAG